MTITDRSLAASSRNARTCPASTCSSGSTTTASRIRFTSTDVNDYIREAIGDDFTAKHFRTWGASVMAFEALASADKDIGLKTMLEPVTEALGNTPAIARKSYVHPAADRACEERATKRVPRRSPCRAPRAISSRTSAA